MNLFSCLGTVMFTLDPVCPQTKPMPKYKEESDGSVSSDSDYDPDETEVPGESSSCCCGLTLSWPNCNTGLQLYPSLHSAASFQGSFLTQQPVSVKPMEQNKRNTRNRRVDTSSHQVRLLKVIRLFSFYLK